MSATPHQTQGHGDGKTEARALLPRLPEPPLKSIAYKSHGLVGFGALVAILVLRWGLSPLYIYMARAELPPEFSSSLGAERLSPQVHWICAHA